MPWFVSKGCATTILTQVGCEMTQIKEHDHHWEDGIEVRLLLLPAYLSSPLP